MFSLNEIEVTGKRAARGAGLPWGIAEEAGKAARWLVERGLPGPRLLAEVLTRNDGRDYADLAPVSDQGTWQAPSGRLCPLIAGAALADRASELAAGGEIALAATSLPLLLAPYAACVAGQTGAAIEIGWTGATLTLMPDGCAIVAEGDALTVRSAEHVYCRRARAIPAAMTFTADRDVDADTWSRLGDFAQRTFAPATEASRLAGAGAGLTDND
ncbi:DUF3726 domain-containing protein [Thalassovita aquimarina]|uniref:DUF3726 domain-containing protein n=1 Tax=Thalassovita aquimarina TaxID=2785917 RepID=A0ABS5HN38_9RHOB|nr:DUF3726 domain-containing protein [Thalassovita aquimarina]MBR9650375.1 DUF3726 domain-containing protein [Thalassovita aquimarina]